MVFNRDDSEALVRAVEGDGVAVSGLWGLEGLIFGLTKVTDRRIWLLCLVGRRCWVDFGGVSCEVGFSGGGWFWYGGG